MKARSRGSGPYPIPKDRQSRSDSRRNRFKLAVARKRAPAASRNTTRGRCLPIRVLARPVVQRCPGPERPTSRLCSEGESVTFHRVATSGTSYPSMGFHFPLRGTVPKHRRDVALWTLKIMRPPSSGMGTGPRVGSLPHPPARRDPSPGCRPARRIARNLPCSESVRWFDWHFVCWRCRPHRGCRPPWGS